MSEDKPTPNGTNPTQRLPSFKPPRDLSLGGVKPKKVFIPNLNVSRNKNKGQTSGSQESKKDDRNRRDRKDRHRPKNGPNIIKSSGVFSEGLGSAERHSTRASYSSRESGDSTPQTLQRPTIRVKNFVKIDKELEDRKIKSVMGDNDSPEDAESHDFKRALEIDAPIKLPMDDGGYLRQTQAVKVKQEVIVKEEPLDDEERAPGLKALPEVKQETSDIPDIVNLLKSEDPKILLLQFPQSLPGRGNSEEDPPHKRNTAPSTSGGEGDQPPKPVDNTCSVSDLEEGKIGKLRVYHSGRVTLQLGDTEFEVSLGTQAAFHQEVVSVAVDDESRSASIVSLGPLTHKLNIVPDWERMFKKMNV